MELSGLRLGPRLTLKKHAAVVRYGNAAVNHAAFPGPHPFWSYPLLRPPLCGITPPGVGVPQHRTTDSEQILRRLAPNVRLSRTFPIACAKSIRHWAAHEQRRDDKNHSPRESVCRGIGEGRVTCCAEQASGNLTPSRRLESVGWSFTSGVPQPASRSR